MRKNLRGFAVILIVIALAVLATGYFIVNKGNKTQVLEPVLENISKAGKPLSPTPFPFREMTIPFLRSRVYDSSLDEMQKVSENSNYVSYLTSYNSDGFKIYGLLTKSQSEKPKGGYPAIVFVHGYIVPENYRTTVNYTSYVDYLAENGFVVFKIDLRGHGNSEGEPGGGYYSGDYVIDTLNAISALRNSDFVNPNKIGLWGHSMAGNIVLRSFAADTKIPVAVIWAGAGYTYTDLQEYSIDDTSYRPPPPDSERARKRQELRDTYGNFDPNHWFWKQVPATNYLEGVSGAIQLNHATDDNVVSVNYSRNLIGLLDKTSVVHELKEYSTGGHNLAGNSFNQAMRNTVEFFNKYL